MSKFKYILRVMVTLLRPVPIGLEWWLRKDQGFLADALPLAMLLLSFSSFPVHKELYMNGFKDEELKKNYASSIAVVLFITLPLYFFSLKAFDFSQGMICFVLLWYVIEKIGDELSRNFTYHSKFGPWYFCQILRFVWPALAILLSFFVPYEKALYICSFLVSVPLVMYFFYGNRVSISKFYSFSFYKGILVKTPYLAGSGFSGVIRQGPRLLINNYFPALSHFYLIVSQCFQIIPVLYNVKFQVPYRKLAARKPKVYLSLLDAIGNKAVFYSVVIFIFSMVFNFTGALVVLIFSYLLSEALIVTVLSNKLGVMMWIFSPVRYFKFMFVSILSSLFILAFFIPRMIEIFSVYGLLAPQIAFLVTIYYLVRRLVNVS